MNTQTVKTTPENARISVGSGKEGVDRRWRISAAVPGLFVKTALFWLKYLGLRMQTGIKAEIAHLNGGAA